MLKQFEYFLMTDGSSIFTLIIYFLLFPYLYRGSDIAKMCRLNSNQFESLAEMALYVCDQAFKLNVTEYQETSRQRAAKALTSMFHGKMNYLIFLKQLFQFYVTIDIMY